MLGKNKSGCVVKIFTFIVSILAIGLVKELTQTRSLNSSQSASASQGSKPPNLSATAEPMSSSAAYSQEMTILASYQGNPFTVKLPEHSSYTDKVEAGVPCRKFISLQNQSPFYEAEFFNTSFGVNSVYQLKNLTRNYMKLCGVENYEMEYLWEEEGYGALEVEAYMTKPNGQPALGIYRMYVQDDRMLILIVSDDEAKSFDEIDRTIFSTVQSSKSN